MKRTKKITKTGMDHNMVQHTLSFTVAKPKVWDDTWTRQYWLERDRVIYKTTKDEQTKSDILERYGKTK